MRPTDTNIPGVYIVRFKIINLYKINIANEKQ